VRPFRSTISIDEARAIVDRTVRPIERRERVTLAEANGRVCAAHVVSTRDVPPFSRAAMDGYAVVAADTAGASPERPATLRLIETVYTGQTPTARVVPGVCAEIATGAPMPDGADAVVMVEETAREGDAVRIRAAVAGGQNVGPQGHDIRAGQVVLHEGDALNPSRIGALAAIGIAEIDTFARPTIAILSTGDELVSPGQALGPGQIYDVNRFTLSAVVADHGGVPVPIAVAEDTPDALDRAIDQSLRSDVLVFSGGSSVGDRDLTIDALTRRGEVLFHGIAVKPGKPTAFGLIDGKPVFGMPGYPTSCLSNAYILLVPSLRKIARLEARRDQKVALPLGQRIVSTAGRHQFYTVRIANGQALPAFKSSGDITSMSQADGYIEIPAGTGSVEAGTLVDVTLF
jgi:molybdenum cofactor synthesis domain-containing protein